MTLTTDVNRDDAQARVSLVSYLSRLQTVLIAPGAALTIGSGIMWSMALVGTGGYQSRVAPVGLSIMTAAGILGAVLVFAVTLPTARKLRFLSSVGGNGQMLAVFESLRRRLAIVSNIAGVCAVASLFASVLAP